MDTTIARISESIGCFEPLQPEWLRVPDAVKLGGVGRSKLYQVIESGEVRSVCLRQKGKMRGIRLINVQSLRDYISSFEKEGDERGQGETDKKNSRRAGKHRLAKSAN